MSEPRAWSFYLAAAALLGLQGCASRSVTLIHPKTGATVTCEEAGSGLMAGAVGARVEDCLRKYESQGYVPAEKAPGAEPERRERGY